MDTNSIKLFQSKKTDDWQTPKEIYNKLNEEFHFDFDPCPLEPHWNGLEIGWYGNIFVNPPYSQIELWLEKAQIELSNGHAKTIVFLVFANTDTEWFHKYVLGKGDIRFLKGRIKFLDREGNKKSGAMRPSILVIYRRNS
jgi:phage N-6-adenine-methyltransferase